METIIPAALKPGTTIALISPSARMNEHVPHRIDRTRSIQTRIDEIHSAFSDPSVGAIICTIGGSTCNELLPHMNYQLIRSHPKIFCGFSDITLLCYAFYVKAGLWTFYGPKAITQWGEHMVPLDFTTTHFFDTVTLAGKPVGRLPCSDAWTDEAMDWAAKADLQRPRTLKANTGWRWLRPGKGEGKLILGCTSSIQRIVGTEFDIPTYADVILLLEIPVGEERQPAPLHRAKAWISDLALHSVFKQVAGLVLGRCFGYDEAMNEEWERYVTEVMDLTERRFPVLARVDVGHTDPILTLPFGASARVDSEQGLWEIIEAGVV